MNSVILIGRLTRDPELRYIPDSGKALTTFSLAVDRGYTGKDGQKQTDFFNIVVWGKSAEYCANYLTKGRLAAVKGNIQNRSYETKEGDKRYVTEIIAENVQVLEWPDKGSSSSKAENKDVFDSKELDPEGFRAIDDDDVPF